MLLLLICILLNLGFIKGDRINIYSPPKNAIYHPNDIMDIRYSIQRMGMSKIWSTNTTLFHVESNTKVIDFPEMKWIYNTSNLDQSIHDVWNVPSNIKNGTYLLFIFANATSTCSKNNDGKLPFVRCNTFIKKNTTFTVEEDII